MFQLPDNWRSLTDAELADLIVSGSGAISVALSNNDGDAVAAIERDITMVRDELTERRRRAELRSELSADVRDIVRETMSEVLGEVLGVTEEVEVDDETVAEIEDAGAGVEEAPAPEAEVEDDAESSTEDDVTDEATEETEGDEGDEDSAPPEELAEATKLPAVPKAGGARAQLYRSIGSYRQGESVPLADADEIFHTVARDLPLESERVRVLTLDTSGDVEFISDDPGENLAILQRAVAKARALNGFESAEGEALVASGGWGTPSQHKYDFFEMEGPVVPLVLPTVGVNRGGLQYLTDGGPTLADIIGTAATWTWTEANDIAATGGSPTKTSLKMPIPTSWTDTRLHADGIVLENGNLVERAWPEHTARWMRLGALAHDRHVNKWIVDGIVALASSGGLNQTQDAVVANDGITASLLHAVEYQSQRIREKYQMGRDVGFDGVFPSWIESMVRDDLNRRTGVDLLGVADSRISGLVRSAGLSYMEPHDYNPLTDENGPWPTSIKFLLWPTGTIVRGTGGSLTLGVFRSESQIDTNDHTALWTEEFFSLMKFGPELREITMPTVTVVGKTGAAGL